MQQTKFDRWLREKYAYITHVYSNTKPEVIPGGVHLVEVNRRDGAPYRYIYSSRNKGVIERLVHRLERENITFTSRVEDLDVWYGSLINNPKKSFSYRLFWIACLVGIGVFALSPAPLRIWEVISADGDAVFSTSKLTVTD